MAPQRVHGPAAIPDSPFQGTPLVSSPPLTCAGSQIATNPGDQGSAAQCGQGEVRPDIEGHGAPPRSHWGPPALACILLRVGTGRCCRLDTMAHERSVSEFLFYVGLAATVGPARRGRPSPASAFLDRKAADPRTTNAVSWAHSGGRRGIAQSNGPGAAQLLRRLRPPATRKAPP